MDKSAVFDAAQKAVTHLHKSKQLGLGSVYYFFIMYLKKKKKKKKKKRRFAFPFKTTPAYRY